MFDFICKSLVLHVGCGVRYSSPIQKHFTLQNPLLRLASTSSSIANEHSFAVSYLINSCGLSPESAVTASKYVNFKTSEKPDSVLAFFNHHGFSKTQISKLVRILPAVLLSNPDKTLWPKLRFFYSKGVSNPDVTKIMSSNPNLFKRSLKNQITPSFEFIKNFLQSDEKTTRAVKRFPGILLLDLQTSVASKINLLQQKGVAKSNIAFLLSKQPRVFLTPCDEFKETVEEVMKMGFDPLRLTFGLAIHVLRSMSESTLERKFVIYERWGWSEEEILEAFRKLPWCLALSEDKIAASMDFFVNKMGRAPWLIARRPNLLLLSLDKTIVPRCSVVQVLVSKGLIKKDVSLSAFLESSEKSFLQKFVTSYEAEALQLLKLYQEKIRSS